MSQRFWKISKNVSFGKLILQEMEGGEFSDSYFKDNFTNWYTHLLLADPVLLCLPSLPEDSSVPPIPVGLSTYESFNLGSEFWLLFAASIPLSSRLILAQDTADHWAPLQQISHSVGSYILALPELLFQMPSKPPTSLRPSSTVFFYNFVLIGK